jgi:hypothetical protein
LTQELFPPQQKIVPIKPGTPSQNKPATDRAIIRNQERFEQLVNEQKRQAAANAAGRSAKIPEQYRLMVEVSIAVLFLTFFGVNFYRRLAKKKKEEKVKTEDKSSGDEIVFYDVK